MCVLYVLKISYMDGDKHPIPQDHYEILGLPPLAEPEEVRRAYREPRKALASGQAPEQVRGRGVAKIWGGYGNSPGKVEKDWVCP